MKDLVLKLVLPNAKAAVAFVVGSGTAWLARKGLVVEPEAVDALVSGLAGVVTALCVWVTANRKV